MRPDGPALFNSGTGPSAAPGPRATNLAKDFRLTNALLCRAVRPRAQKDAAASEKRRRRYSTPATARVPENRYGWRRCRSLRDPDLGQEFAAAADEISAEYGRRLAGIRGLTGSQRAVALRAIKEWRAAARTALRQTFDAKTATAKDQRMERLPRETWAPRRPRPKSGRQLRMLRKP